HHHRHKRELATCRRRSWAYGSRGARDWVQGCGNRAARSGLNQREPCGSQGKRRGQYEPWGFSPVEVVRPFVCDIHQISGLELYGAQTSIMEKMPISSAHCKSRMEPHRAETS